MLLLKISLNLRSYSISILVPSLLSLFVWKFFSVSFAIDCFCRSWRDCCVLPRPLQHWTRLKERRVCVFQLFLSFAGVGNMHPCGVWEEAGEARENPRRTSEVMQGPTIIEEEKILPVRKQWKVGTKNAKQIDPWTMRCHPGVSSSQCLCCSQGNKHTLLTHLCSAQSWPWTVVADDGLMCERGENRRQKCTVAERYRGRHWVGTKRNGTS